MSGKYSVCFNCDGEGTVDNYGSFTNDDLDEQFGNLDERDEFLESYRNGAYDIVCPTCKGKRVLTAEEIETARDIAEMHAEMEAERRFGC